MENTKRYEFRRLNSTDIFVMASLISKIGIKDFGRTFQSEEIVDMIRVSGNAKGTQKSAKPDDIAAKVGIGVVLNIADKFLENLPKCEDEIFRLLSRVSGLPEREIRDFEPAEFAEMVIDFCKKEELRDFIAAVSKLRK